MTNTNTYKRSITTALLVFVTSFVVFILCQYSNVIIDYEARFIVFLQYAMQHGLTYFPMIHGGPYPDYPIGNTAMLYWASLPFGKVAILPLSIPYALAAALTVTFTYKIAELHDRKWAFAAILFIFFTWQYMYNVHNIAVDVYPVLSAVFCFYLAYTAKLFHTKARLWLLPIGLLFGLFTRGPIGLVIPAVVVGSFYLLNRDWKAVIIFGFASIFLLALGFALLLGGAYLQGGHSFMMEVLSVESIGRIENYHKSRYFFYFTVGILPYLITILFAVFVGITKCKDWLKAKTEADKLLQYLVFWVAVLILGFTIPHTKQARYILAITPAIALLAGYMFAGFNMTFTKSRAFLKILCFLMPFLGLVVLAGALIGNHYFGFKLFGYFLPAGIILGTLAFINILVTIMSRNPQRYEMVIFILGVIAFLVILVLLLQPLVTHAKFHKEPLDQIIYLPFWPF